MQDKLERTNVQFRESIDSCRKVFETKLRDYGPSWRIMRPESVTDQIFIKAKRIRTLEQNQGQGMVDEGILGEFMAIVNYGIIGLIQLSRGAADESDISIQKAITLYDEQANKALELMKAKNHDYDEAWRGMRIQSYTDLILTKIQRAKQIEEHKGKTEASEGIDANYMDMIVYAVFGIIKLTEQA